MRLCLADRLGLLWAIFALLFAWLICGGQTPVAEGGGSVSQMIGWFFVFWLPPWLLLRMIDFAAGGPYRRADAGTRTLSLGAFIGAAIVLTLIGFAIFIVVGCIGAMIHFAMQPHPDWGLILGGLVFGIVVILLCLPGYLVQREMRHPRVEIIPPDSRRE